MTGARQSEVVTGRDAEEIEVRIAVDLAEQAEHLRVERLRRGAGRPRGNAGLEAYGNRDRAIPTRQRAGSVHGQCEVGIRAFRFAAERTTRLIAGDTLREVADRWRAYGAAADEIFVDGAELNRRAWGKSVDDLVHVRRAEVIATRGRKRDGAAAVIRHDALRSGQGLDATVGRARVPVVAVGRHVRALACRRAAEIVGADLSVVAADGHVQALSGVHVAAVGRARVSVVAVRGDARRAPGGHANGRRGASRHAAQVSAGVADEVDLVGDVEEAIDRPIGALLRERRLAGAREAVVGAAGDPEQVEIRISRRQLTLKPVHVGRELLHRRAVDPRADVRFEADRNLQRAHPARERSRAVQRERQRRIRALFTTTERAARLIACRRRGEVADPGWRAVRPSVAHEVTVDSREPNGRPCGKPVDDLVNVGRAKVTAARGRQGHSAGAVVRNHARGRVGIEGRRDDTQRRNENDTQQGRE